MACENGLVYYIIGIATLASGMTIYWVGYIEHSAGGLDLVDSEATSPECVEIRETESFFDWPEKCKKVVEQDTFFNWHVTMMMWPFVMCATLAITAFRKFENRKVAKIFHVVFHCVALSAALSAFGMGYASNQARWGPDSHFATMHSWVGMVTLVLYSLNFIAGLFLYLFNGKKI